MLKTAINVLKKIENGGYKAYIVGGYPRDLYLNRKSVDIDICTSATPKDLKKIFSNISYSDIKYGSATLICNKTRFEITTFRKEIKYENNRKPVKIKYINDLLEDLKRRDFVINTLCINTNGDIIDLLDARQDLDNRVIRMVGKPKPRLKEDVLRILRAVRFATTLDFELDLELEKNVVKYGHMLKRLSYERKREELDKIFSSCNVGKGIKLLIKTKLDKHLELENLSNLKITSSLIGIWAQLDVLNIYKFSGNEMKNIKLINELLEKEVLDNYNLYKYGLYISTVVGEIKGIDRKTIINKFNNLYISNKSEIAISTKEICKLLNKEPSSFLKSILLDLEEKIVYKKLPNDNKQLKSYIIKKYCK